MWDGNAFASYDFRIQIWRWYTLGLYFIYFIATIQLIPQIIGLIGANGITPLKPRLQACKRDFPCWKHLVYFPTYMWISSHDWFMLALLWVGSASALYMLFFGLNTLAAFMCWSVYVSFMLPAQVVWPWDGLLSEAGFLALFLPTSGLPHPVVAFAHRWLMFRLMFGFGKMKFVGTSKNDNLYLRAFMTSQPIPSRCGFFVQSLPDFVHKLGLLFFFIAEIPIPFSFLYSASWPWGVEIRLIGALTTILLQFGIFSTGNFGFFNFLSAVLCLPLLDMYNVAPSFQEMAHILMLLFPLSIMTFLFNSWINQSWFFIPGLRILDPVRRFYRILQPLCIVNCYGVFPPHTFPTERFVPVIEGSADGKTWLEYEYKFLDKLPWLLSPYHPRFEYTFFYTGMLGIDNMFFFHAQDPYHFSRFPMHHRIAQRLLEGASPSVRRIFKSDPFPKVPPRFVRVALYMFEPMHQKEAQIFYKKTYLHMQLPAVQSRPQLWSEYILSPPEWHFDLNVWRDRYDRLWGEQKLPEPLPLFWEFIDLFQFDTTKCDEMGWSNYMRQQVTRFRSQYSNAQRREIERELGKYTWVLIKKIDPMLPTLYTNTACKSFTYLGLLAHIIISKGMQEIEECLKSGSEQRIESIAKKDFFFDHGMYIFTLFWYETMRYQAIKFRLMASNTVFDPLPPALEHLIPGFIRKEFTAWITKQFIPTPEEDDEFIPLYMYDEAGLNLKGIRKLITANDIPPPTQSKKSI
eukprot:Phypoly_transcript_03641.p1 GENE.Phypoly_transcript_03641~~Phypoly_transcript_03641.p1  ORF type:complete len:743 (+),score=59.51 Phypoly_transcript_03641:103-2331(+)